MVVDSDALENYLYLGDTLNLPTKPAAVSTNRSVVTVQKLTLPNATQDDFMQYALLVQGVVAPAAERRVTDWALRVRDAEQEPLDGELYELSDQVTSASTQCVEPAALPSLGAQVTPARVLEADAYLTLQLTIANEWPKDGRLELVRNLAPISRELAHTSARASGLPLLPLHCAPFPTQITPPASRLRRCCPTSSRGSSSRRTCRTSSRSPPPTRSSPT